MEDIAELSGAAPASMRLMPVVYELFQRFRFEFTEFYRLKYIL
jgi:hypothetical protein